MMFSAPPERHPQIEEALPELRKFQMKFESRGSRIILFH